MLLLIAEIMFSIVAAVGVGMIYLPAGVIVFGLLGVLACEYTATRLRAATQRPVPTERIP